MTIRSAARERLLLRGSTGRTRPGAVFDEVPSPPRERTFGSKHRCRSKSQRLVRQGANRDQCLHGGICKIDVVVADEGFECFYCIRCGRS